MPTESLLHEFPPVTTDEWEAAIKRDLKGADYASKLIWHAEEDLDIKPTIEPKIYAAEVFSMSRLSCRPVAGAFEKKSISPTLRKPTAPHSKPWPQALKRSHSPAPISPALPI